MNAVSAAMWLIASRNPLPAYYFDHALTGEYNGYRELHIGGDYLLVYYVDAAGRTVAFSDLGTHAELFE
jgi:mRNA interferase YafQ